ncbi:hypothetical protein ACU639_34270 [Streptomyces cynarae]|uniref:hypothetical protein n=1 Tax=Streptomyces cynarae TaxID=2981134 RepID=UPI00406D092D
MLSATGGAVPQRVRALLAPPPPRRTLPFVAGALLLTVCCASLANAASDSQRMIETAQRAECLTQAGAADAPSDDRPSHGPGSCCDHHHGEREGHG